MLGWDFSGVIEQTGSKVQGWKPGDAVYGRPDVNRNGTYAEYVAVRADEIARKPASIDHKAASGVAKNVRGAAFMAQSVPAAAAAGNGAYARQDRVTNGRIIQS
jgi:NADPH:quinone reductase-like Zn-dependent oxidoreductase